MLNSQSKIFILSGPSGVGKTSLFNMLKQKDARIRKTISLTTRSARPGEVDGIDYFFVDHLGFQSKIDNNLLLEWSKRGNDFYGTLVSQVFSSKSDFVFLVIDVDGAFKVRSKVDCFSIFIMPPSIEELESRLRGRATESEYEIQRRLSFVKEEIEKSSLYDCIVVCDDLGKCCDELYNIVLKHA